MTNEFLKVHVIDDDLDDVFFIEDMLKKSSNQPKFKLTHSTNIKEGIQKLTSDRPEVVLLDLGLPDASGLEGLNKIRSQIPTCNIIILTGHADDEYGLRALKSGAKDFLNKNKLEGDSLVKSILYCHERFKLEESLRQSQKLEAIGQLAGGIAHDYNNQMGILSLLVEQLEDQAIGNEEILATAKDMIAIIDKCNYMTKQILGFSRKQSLFPKAISLNSVVGQIVPFASRLIGSDVQLEFDLKEDVNVFIDRNQLEQVLWNLVLNAKHSLEEEKYIKIKTGKIHSTKVRGLIDPIEKEMDFALIEVTDTGKGIEKDLMSKIFDPFFSTKPIGSGTGLGLSSALGFIRQSGGYMSVQSELGRGSVFQILLPIHNQSSVSNEQSKSEAALNISDKNYHALVCDDEPLLRKLIASALISKGFKVTQAGDGLDAYNKYQAAQPAFDVIITDLTMPKMTGVDLIHKIQESNSEIKCVFISGFSQLNTEKLKYLENITEIEKPFAMDFLLEKIYSLLEKTTKEK